MKSGCTSDFKTAIAQVFVDGQFVGSVDANQDRADLVTAFSNPAAKPHGYTYNVPSGSVIKNGQWHTIQVKPCDGSFLPHHNKILCHCPRIYKSL